MKQNLHSAWHKDAKVTCSCGNTFTVGSTRPEITVEICSACHPFFTGEHKFVDAQGRVEKFQARQTAAAATKFVSKKQKLVQKKLQEQKDNQGPKTLREMLTEAK